MKQGVLPPNVDMLTDCVLATVAIWVNEDVSEFGCNREGVFDDKLSDLINKLKDKKEQF